jgi:exo-beta-1,3-glucanase (GH17 family)
MQMSRIDIRTAQHSVQQSALSARPTSFFPGRQAVNIMRSVTSIFASYRRLVPLGLCLGLAACGSSQNWQDDSQFVTVSGSVAGFTGGTLALWNNGGDKLAIPANGRFTFPLQIANGSGYAVVVAVQPEGLTCTVANGVGTARGNVTGVTVNCAPYTFTRRSLPAIYSTGKAVNYSAYRTAGGPREFEVPSDAEVIQDLTLLDLAGFDLLRLFGAEAPATDIVAEKILRLAAQNFPDMKFQLGLAVGGVTSCSDTKNDRNISYLITNLAKYPNVVAISVGNETSFFSKFSPLPCLESYIRTIRSQVTQPVTTDDDWTFYAGKSTGGGDRVDVKPDTILPLIDFAAIHMYPISYPVWDWQQTGVAAGPARAQAMMETSLVALKEWYGEVVDYRYVGAGGVTVSIGDSMPIVVGETGWKARQTNPASEIEQYAALPPNAKWYFDLLYGNPGKYPSWQGSVGGPPTIFYFVAFDEQWKGIDDGWGLWDLSRQARYTLCGLPAGPACKPDVYEGAGYFNPPPFSTVTFDSPSINYALVGFAGAEDSQVVADPVGGANKVARVNRSATADTFAGTVVGTAGLTVGTIPFDASNTRMTVRVYSPAAGIPVRLKIEDSANTARAVETEAVTTRANAWEVLTFDFAAPATGSPALNPTYDYNRLIIFFNFGATGATAGAQTYYFDDMAFIGGGGLPIGPFADLSFDSTGLVYTLTGFGGAEDSSLQPDPTNAANTTVRVNRAANAETFAGTVVSTGPSLTAGTIPFTVTNTRMTVRVYSPAAGVRVRLKVESAQDPSRSVETEAVTTVANAWETLTFNFANEVSGTPALNPSYNYNRLIIFFDFGQAGSAIGARTYYFDDVLFVSGGGGGGTIVFASGFKSNNRTVEDGEWGFYSGNFTNYTNTYAGGGFVDGAGAVPPADSFVYLVVATSAPTTDGFMGIFTMAPGYTGAAPNAGVTLNGQANLKIELGMAAEWFQQATNKALTVRLIGSQVYSNGAGGFCQILVETPVTPTTADLTLYTISLNSMTLAQACNGGGFTSGVTTLAEALARPIGEVHVQAIFPRVNTTVTNGAGTEYPTGFTRGSVSFE